MDEVMTWIETHPWLAAALGLGGLLVLLWLLGYFSSSSSSSASSGTNLAAAYYNAEAAQTTAGTQLQEATEYYTNQTAQAQIQASGAEAIATTEANMSTTLGQQQAGLYTSLGSDQLLASENSNDDALAASNNANLYAYQTATAGYNASTLATAMNTIIPQEMAMSGGASTISLPGIGNIATYGGPPSPNQLLAAGYTIGSPAYEMALGGYTYQPGDIYPS